MNYTLSKILAALSVGDLNRDGKPDESVAVLLNNGDGSLGTPSFYDVSAAGMTPDGIAIADFNLDGKPDMAVVNFVNAPGLLYGNGDGTFQNVVALDDGPKGGMGVAAADFDQDGAPDVAFGIFTQSPKLAVLLNTQ